MRPERRLCAGLHEASARLTSLFGDADFKRWYDTGAAATLKWQTDVVDGRLWFAHVDFETGVKLDHRQTELDAFYGGLLGQGGHMKAGRAYTLSWAAVQDKYGVLPEGFDYQTFTATTPSNALRPELADSCINLWLLERDEVWRRIGRTHFENMKRWNRAPYGHTGLKDVTTTPKIQADPLPRLLVVGADEIPLAAVLRHAALRLPDQLSVERR